MKKLIFLWLLFLVPALHADTYSGLSSIARDGGFQSRVQVALYIYSVQTVVTEGAGVTSHASRLAYAIKILSNNVSVGQVALMIVSDGTISQNADSASSPDFGISDTAILAFISTNFTKMAALN